MKTLSSSILTLSAEGEKTATRIAVRCLSVIVPVYNEAFTIRQILARVQESSCVKEILVVDDGSTDGTRRILKAIDQERKNSPPLSFLFHKENQGKGACIRTALTHVTGDLVIIQDADLEYDPREYSKLIEPILSGDADVVYGSRFRGERRRVLLFWHTLGNKLLTFISNICTNLNLSDMETCYKVFKSEIIKSLPIRSNRFGFEPEITSKVAKLRCRIFEMPISYNGRGYAEGKKINWKDGLAALWTILKYWVFDDLYEETAGLRTLRIMEGAGKYNQWLYSQCKPYIGRRVLEVGAGVGNITKYLLDRDVVLATDIIDFYLKELRTQFRHFEHVHVQPFNLLDSATSESIKNKFKPDSILCLNVLEHIKEDQLALRTLHKSLGDSGKLILVVPAHASLFSNMDHHLGHFRRYNKKGLQTKLELAGFEIQKITYMNMLGALGWFVNGRIFRRKLVPSRQLRAFDLLIRFLSFEKEINPPFGLSVLAVARKKEIGPHQALNAL